jgi:hypothetical protein
LQATGAAAVESANDSPRELNLQNDRDLTMTLVERLHSDSPPSIKNFQGKDSGDKNEDNDDNADSNADDLRRDYQDDDEDDDTSL